METIPRKTLTEDEWNRKNHVWKNADPTTRGEGRDFNGIDNYEQYLKSLDNQSTLMGKELNPNYTVDPNTEFVPVPRLNAGIKNDGTVGGSMPSALRDYFSRSGGMPPNSGSPLFSVYRNWLNSQKAKADPDWNMQDANNFDAYLQSFNGTGTGDSIPRANRLYNDIMQKLQTMTPEEQLAYARQIGVNI